MNTSDQTSPLRSGQCVPSALPTPATIAAEKVGGKVDVVPQTTSTATGAGRYPSRPAPALPRKSFWATVRGWLIQEIDENHPNALSNLDIRDGVGTRR